MHRTPSGDRRQALKRDARELADEARDLEDLTVCGIVKVKEGRKGSKTYTRLKWLLALGYQRACDLLRAREYTMQALAADPSNPVALKNLGAILGKEGDSLRALYYLRRSFEIDPQDPQTVYALAFAYMELGDIEPAQKHFQKLASMHADAQGLLQERTGKQ
jgi:tetratricopeptide (TPR) repeat protein